MAQRNFLARLFSVQETNSVSLPHLLLKQLVPPQRKTSTSCQRSPTTASRIVDDEFDYGGYFTACSRTTNSTSGTIINPVQSARISTLLSARRANASDSARADAESALNRDSIRYGKIEVRAKMPSGDWLWPAIRLLPVNDTYGAWPASGEIDMGSLNWGPTVGLNAESLQDLLVVGRPPHAVLERLPHVHARVDGQLAAGGFWKRGEFPTTVKDARSGQTIVLQDPWLGGTRATPFDQDFYLIMNVAVGGTNGWFPDGQGNKPWLNQARNPMQDFINNNLQGAVAAYLARERARSRDGCGLRPDVETLRRSVSGEMGREVKNQMRVRRERER
ncbi:concanavalin A-like lectin/glucanase domain-containing protein [Mycena sanguinolenta]|nr:concanavalin A-like lectin/glucanase domain-containing protein [Mycena sanguinolenta]